MTTLTEGAFAKINLTLDVLDRREDGYHDIRSILQTVALRDDIELLLDTGTGWRIECETAGIPLDETNLAWRAARVFFDTFGGEPDGLTIRITKRIPSGAGLGGGSADAAAVLRALNRWKDYPLSVYALCELGAQIGSDVPFCVLCGTALAEGRGERLTKLPDAPEMFTVICKPDVSFSTPALYAKLDDVALAKRPDTRAMRAALEKGDLEAIGAGLCNVFEQVAIPDHLELNYIKSIMMSYGAYGAQMTGSCAVFVPNAAPDEEYDLRITHVGRHAAYGRIERILTASPDRCTRLCPDAKRCGGCDFWHLRYPAECRIKAQRVTDALNRIGGQNLPLVALTPAPACEGYRNKAQFPVAMGKNGIEAGFFEKGTHNVVPVEHCRIQPACAEQARSAVLRYARRWSVPAYDEAAHTGLLRHIYVRHAEATGQVLVCLVVNGERLPQEDALVDTLRKAVPGLRSVVLNTNTRRGNAVLGETMRTLWGGDAIEDILCGLRFRISPRSFYQVNRTQAERLYGKALAAAGLTGTETVLDLYCGTGTITLCLARQAKRAIGVELVEAAIRDAQENARRNGIGNAEFFCADAGQAAQRLCAAGETPDVIVVDPPRKGLSADVIEAMVRMAPQRIVYVSCDPATLARDVRSLTQQGYALTHAEAVDLFPRCAHVETVCRLERVK